MSIVKWDGLAAYGGVFLSPSNCDSCRVLLMSGSNVCTGHFLKTKQGSQNGLNMFTTVHFFIK